MSASTSASAEEQVTESPVARHHTVSADEPLMTEDWEPDFQIPLDLLRVWASRDPSAPIFGSRPLLDSGARSPVYVFETRDQIWARVRKLAWAMTNTLGLRRGDRVSFFSITRGEIHVLLWASAAIGVEVVPIYESLVGAETITYIIGHASVSAVFVSSAKAECLSAALNSMPEGTQRPRCVVSFDSPVKGFAEQTYSSLIDSAPDSCAPQGNYDRIQGAAKPDDAALIMYTSGTTGLPKGVVLTHRNLHVTAIGIVQHIPKRVTNMEFLLLSFLPLAHIFGLAIDYTALRVGGTIGFYSGSLTDLPADMKILRPTCMTSVPRLYQRVYDATMETLAKKPFYLRGLFNAAWVWKNLWSWYGFRTPITDRIVFSEIRKQIGGRMKICICGGAAVSNEVADFWRTCVVDYFWIGYGMTETAALGIATQLDFGTEAFTYAMSPFVPTEAKVISVPSMNYLATDNPPKGELCIRGANCTRGYLNDPVRSAQAIDKDGWVHTGDIAMMVGPRSFRIIDRVKDLFKLSQGEYVSGEMVEGALCRSLAIAQAFVTGHPDKNFPVAIVIPNVSWIEAFAKSNGIPAGTPAALCQNESVKIAVMNEVQRVSREAKLKGYEIPKSIHLHPEQFDVENGFLTPSLKLKRHLLRNTFQRQIEDMYDSLMCPSCS